MQAGDGAGIVDQAEGVKPVVFACDENYAPYLSVVIQSLLDNAHLPNIYEIIILDCSTVLGAEKFEEAVADLKNMLVSKPDFSLKVIRVRDILAGNTFLQKNEQALRRYGYGTYARILIPDLLSDYDKALYLDVDHIILGDIADMYSFPLGDKLIACVPDVNAAYMRLAKGFKRKQIIEGNLGLTNNDYYVIASPMLFNLKACRGFNFTEKVLSFLAQNQSLPFPDQDAINSVCRGRILYLPQKWGQVNSPSLVKLCAYIQKELDKEHSNVILGDWRSGEERPSIIHYVASPKPWAGTRSDYSDIWWHYAAETRRGSELLFRLLYPLASSSKKICFIETYKIFGIPFLTVKNNSKGKFCFLGGIPVFHRMHGKENTYVYVLGLKLLAIRRRYNRGM